MLHIREDVRINDDHAISVILLYANLLKRTKIM